MANHSREIPVAVSSSGSGVDVPVSRVDFDAAGDGADPDHHLWRNGRLWWIAFTVHRGHVQERLRFSLRTDDVEIARRRRDKLFALYASAAECRISIRFAPRRGSSARKAARGQGRRARRDRRAR